MITELRELGEYTQYTDVLTYTELRSNGPGAPSLHPTEWVLFVGLRGQ